MAKISALPLATQLLGDEQLPIVQRGKTKTATMTALRALITPFLEQWYKGDKGDPGGDTSAVGPTVTIPTLSIAAHVRRIRTTGKIADGDGGAALFDRVPSGEVLAPAGQGIWWTTDFDGGVWRIAADQAHYAPMFGAMGQAGLDAAPVLRQALAAPMVRVLNIGALVHDFVPPLDIPPGKIFRGVTRTVSGMRVIPIDYDDGQNGPRFSIRHVNDRGGGSSDYFIDLRRSGYDERRLDSRRTHGLTIIATPGNSCIGTRVSNVDVYNTWGYAFYMVGQLGMTSGRVRDVGISDCTAANFQVGFEATGDVDRSWTRNTMADATSQDGGELLPTEATYHEYGALKAFTRYSARARGTAANGALIFTTDGADIIGPLRYVDPDIDVQGNFGMFVEGRDGNRVRNFEVVGGRIASSAMGALFRRGDVVVRQSTLVGRDGPGMEGGTDATVDLHAPDIEGNRDTAGDTGAYGVTNDGARIRWFGTGSLVAHGPEGLAFPAGEGAIDFMTAPILSPATAFDSAVRVSRMITDLPFEIPASKLVLDSGDPAFPGVRSYRGTLDLATIIRPGGVRNRSKTIIAVPPLEIPFPSGGVYSPEHTLTILWIDNTQVRIYINTKASLNGWTMRGRITEFL